MIENIPNGRDKNKSGRIILLVVGVLALALGVWRVSYGIKAPFMRTPIAGNVDFRTEDQINEAKKYFDTDSDGLSDYDEEFIYITSPYLKDSDSDGIDDKAEIDKGTDPNCPEGKDCHGNNLVNPEATATSTAPDGVSPAGDLSEGGGSAGSITLTPEQIRNMLRESGAPEESLKKITDAELMKIYAESVKQVAEEQAATTTE